MHPDTEALRQKLAELNLEHRTLDAQISAMLQQPHYDELQVTRLKKRKLLLKDMIARLNSQLIPDQPA